MTETPNPTTGLIPFNEAEQAAWISGLVKEAIDINHAAQKPGELIGLGHLIINRGYETAIEIGTSYGGMAWFLWALGLTVTSIDDCNEATLRMLPSTHGFVPVRIPEINYVVGNSSMQVGLGTADVIFIDGDHRYEGVRADWEHWRGSVNPGGIVAFHDIVANAPENSCEVKRLFDEIAAEYPTATFIDPTDDGYAWGGIDESGNRPPWGGIGVVFL